MIRVAIANQKGGVGKTTTAINIATAMAATGWRTLLIDLDPQGNASTGMGIAAADRTRSSYDLLVDGVPLADCIMPTSIPGLDIVPATVDLTGLGISQLAYLGAGLSSDGSVPPVAAPERTIAPSAPLSDEVHIRFADAVKRARGWRTA